jgi:hypothetical protein
MTLIEFLTALVSLLAPIITLWATERTRRRTSFRQEVDHALATHDRDWLAHQLDRLHERAKHLRHPR